MDSVPLREARQRLFGERLRRQADEGRAARALYQETGEVPDGWLVVHKDDAGQTLLEEFGLS